MLQNGGHFNVSVRSHCPDGVTVQLGTWAQSGLWMILCVTRSMVRASCCPGVLDCGWSCSPENNWHRPRTFLIVRTWGRRGGPQASGGQSPVNILQCTGQPQPRGMIRPKVSAVLSLTSPVPGRCFSNSGTPRNPCFCACWAQPWVQEVWGGASEFESLISCRSCRCCWPGPAPCVPRV